jgi:hypothetical protein
MSVPIREPLRQLGKKAASLDLVPGTAACSYGPMSNDKGLNAQAGLYCGRKMIFFIGGGQLLD